MDRRKAMIKLDGLLENYEDEVLETVKLKVRKNALKAYRAYVAKLPDPAGLPEQDALEPEWQMAVMDVIQGKEVVQDPKWKYDPVVAADKLVHKAFMSWLEL
jgi:hypothetical protein